MIMDNTSILVLKLTAAILLGFGVLVLLWSLYALLKGKDISLLWTRYLAWFLIAPPLILPLVFSRIGFQCVVMVISMLSFREYSRVVGLWKDKKLMCLIYLMILSIYIPIFSNWYGLYQAMPIYAVAVILTIPIQRDKYENMIQKSCLSVLGIVYFGWFFSHLAFLRNFNEGVGYIFFLFVIVEANDAFAYLWGSLLGRHKLTPRISPNKTKEGAICSMVSVVLLAFALRFLLPRVSGAHILLISLMLSLFGMCGDLTISFIKRDLHIKDMGNIIPGHGGLLDRFDSIIFTAPLYFHFLRYIYE